MATIWLDGTKMYIEAGSAKEVRLLEEAEERGYVKQSDGVNYDGYDIIWIVNEKKGGE